MIKLRTTLGVFGLSVLILLTGCADKGTTSNTDVKLIPITTVSESFNEETNKIRNREFDNINFENAYFSFPAATEVCTLEYRSEITEFTWSPDEAYDYICKRIDEFFPKMYSDEQKAYEIRFADVQPVNMEAAEDIYRWPDLKQYKEMELITERPVPMIDNNNSYIELFCGVLRGYDQGELAKRSEHSGALDLFDALATFPIVYRTENLESEKTYHLASGDISIADAVQSANKCLSALELSFRKLPLKPKVQSVNVLDIGDGCFAFCFKIVTEYKQIGFNALEMDKTIYGVSTISDATNEIDLFGEAIMYEADKITRYKMLSPFAYSDITETNSYNSVIPFEKAAEITSDHLTSGIKFKALSVTAVYKLFSDKDPMQYAEGEYKHRKITVNPCWRFILKPTTGDNKKLYYVYVDMITGKAYTCVQQMESDVEYD